MTNPFLEWSVATVTLPGEVESGDLHLVQPFEGGTLVAVADGLGHGTAAASAARAAVDILAKHPREPVLSLAKRCHQGLRGTRGVVLSMATFNAREETMTWLGVGNVEGTLIRSDAHGKPECESLLLRRGVLGARLPILEAVILPVTRGDTLILATDGIRSGFERGVNLRKPPQEIADQIVARDNLGTDDALVLVARFKGAKQ